MTVETVECNVGVRCSVEVEVAPDCPCEKDETDDYTIRVEWKPAGETFERHWLHDELRRYCGTERSQEMVAYDVYTTLEDAYVTSLKVTVVNQGRRPMEVSYP